MISKKEHTIEQYERGSHDTGHRKIAILTETTLIKELENIITQKRLMMVDREEDSSYFKEDRLGFWLP